MGCAALSNQQESLEIINEDKILTTSTSNFRNNIKHLTLTKPLFKRQYESADFDETIKNRPKEKKFIVEIDEQSYEQLSSINSYSQIQTDSNNSHEQINSNITSYKRNLSDNIENLINMYASQKVI